MFTKSLRLLAFASVAAMSFATFAQEAEPVTMTSEVLDSFVIPEINQAIGVDAEHFYAIDNTTIAKYTKDTHELVKLVDYKELGAIHFDSASVVDGKIYIAIPTTPSGR